MSAPTHLPLGESFDVEALIELAYQIEVTTRVREEEDDRPPLRGSDMAGLAALCFEWFQRALDQIDPEHYEVPGILFIFRHGVENMVNYNDATAADFDEAITSRMAEAMACMAEAWWAVQQAAFLDVDREVRRG